MKYSATICIIKNRKSIPMIPLSANNYNSLLKLAKKEVKEAVECPETLLSGETLYLSNITSCRKLKNVKLQ